MPPSKPKRNHAIDLIKGMATLMVCYHHARGKGILPDYLLAFVRMAVPLFVMCTSYFYIDTTKKRKEGKQIKKYLMIALQMAGIYILLDYGTALIQDNFFSYLKECVTWENLKLFILYNDPIHANHSWYMWAMIYVLLLVWTFPFLWKNSISRILLILPTALALPMLSKVLRIARFGISTSCYRNFLMPVFAYFILGIFCREHMDDIKKMPTKIWALFTGMFSLFLFIEKTIFYLKGNNIATGTYFSLLPLAFCTFCLCQSYEGKNKLGQIIENFGKKYSLYFYILHPVFIRIEKKVFQMDTPQQYLGFVFVVITTCAASVLCFHFRKSFWAWMKKRKDGSPKKLAVLPIQRKYKKGENCF